MSFFIIILTTLSFFPCWTAYAVYLNYKTARLIGLPIILSPVDTFNPIWVLIRPYLTPVLSHLPFSLGAFTRYSYLNWSWVDKYQLHARLGPAFVIVTPVECQIIVADATAADSIMTRRKDCTKKPAVYAPFNIFGPNVNVTEGETWQRHRKITTPPFNERNSSLVWRESARQASEMLETWLARGIHGTTRTTADIYLLALHVLSGAGFGVSYPFNSPLKTPTPGHKLSYIDALRTILEHVFVTIIIGSSKIPTWLLPRSVALVSEAISEFKAYMVETVERERQSYRSGETSTANLMSSLVRASEDAGSKNGLADDEIYGNLFIYNIAGHETTATALGYAIAHLAASPKWQHWIGEEIDTVLNEAEVTYETAFPRLPRCLALMYETLRLYAPLNAIPRWTGAFTQNLTIGESGKTYSLPPKTAVFVNVAALSSNPAYWGNDALVWRPDRWITENTFTQPLNGAYLPWASGPRVCPGKKFSQVEFVAVIARLFRENRVVPVLEAGEDMRDALRRILGVVEDSAMGGITIQMRRPERLWVKWVGRGKCDGKRIERSTWKELMVA